MQRRLFLASVFCKKSICVHRKREAKQLERDSPSQTENFQKKFQIQNNTFRGKERQGSTDTKPNPNEGMHPKHGLMNLTVLPPNFSFF
jgi:hypothetical protein